MILRNYSKSCLLDFADLHGEFRCGVCLNFQIIYSIFYSFSRYWITRLRFNKVFQFTKFARIFWNVCIHSWLDLFVLRNLCQSPVHPVFSFNWLWRIKFTFFENNTNNIFLNLDSTNTDRRFTCVKIIDLRVSIFWGLTFERFNFWLKSRKIENRNFHVFDISNF